MHYIIYQITNKINGKIYIGKHVCKSIHDLYMSGCREVWKDIKQYGRDNFEKIILCECSNQEELDKKEAEFVTSDFIKRSDTYNQQIGGRFRGNKIDYSSRPEIKISNKVNSNNYWQSIRNDQKKREERDSLMKNIRKRIKQREDYSDIRDRTSKSVKKFYETHDGTFLGKCHSDETKQKISIAHKEFHKLHGPTWNINHHWYYDPITKTNLILTEQQYEETYKNMGWVRGRWIFKN